MTNKWEKAQKWEKDWHGNCVNTYQEECKQFLYAEKMGLVRAPNNKTIFRFDLEEKSILDIGGGPVSLLLKCQHQNLKFPTRRKIVIDPLEFPHWVEQRYKEAGIEFYQTKGEDFFFPFELDEIWIYNVLQHCEDPKKIIENAKEAGKLIRIFEWLDTLPNEGHPNKLTEKELNQWLEGEGRVETLNGQNYCVGKAYYGIFPTK